MNINDNSFTDFVKHILSFEGGLSKDERDTAIKCAPFKGAYHTNKGVTYCTFKELATNLGITNTYDKFISLNDNEVAKFIYYYYKDANGDKLPKSIGLSVTEAAWGSGKSRAIKNLQESLFNLGKIDKDEIDGYFGAATEQAANSVDENTLFVEFWKVRQKFIDSLTKEPKYAMFKKGWQNRINSFLSNVNFANVKNIVKKNTISTVLIIAIFGVIAFKLITKKK